MGKVSGRKGLTEPGCQCGVGTVSDKSGTVWEFFKGGRLGCGVSLAGGSSDLVS